MDQRNYFSVWRTTPYSISILKYEMVFVSRYYKLEFLEKNHQYNRFKRIALLFRYICNVTV